MKILNKNKIIVSALALAIGASLAGSISGTVAWYQYSTRANVALIGEAGGFSGNLQMRFVGDNDWKTRITWTDMNNYLASKLQANEEMNLVPMTFGTMGKASPLPQYGYVQPVAGISDMSKWAKATNKNYAQFQLELRYNERDGRKEGEPAVDGKNIELPVYLSKLVIKEHTVEGKKDLSNAVRVHISSSYNDGVDQLDNKLISKNGGTILTQGKLDLDGDGYDDKAYPDNDEFGFNDPGDDSTLQDIVYGSGEQTSYGAVKDYNAAHTYIPYGATDSAADPIHPVLVGQDGNVLTDLTYNDGMDRDKMIGKTMASDTNFLTVTITVWVEGWQELDGSAIWDEVDYIKSKFDLGIQFAVQDASAR